MDIAGLVKGAAEGQGLGACSAPLISPSRCQPAIPSRDARSSATSPLRRRSPSPHRPSPASSPAGNAFLSHISQVDGIFHVMRAFDDADVIHVEDRVDPIDDIQIITRELRLKDIAALERIVSELRKMIPRGLKKEQKEELASAEKVLAWIQEGKEIRNGMDVWNAKDVDFLNENNFLSAKPVVYLVNLSPEDYVRKKNKWLAKVAEWVQNNGGGKIIPFSGKIESDVQEMPEDERAKYLEENKLESALPKIIKTGFSAIHLIYFFTAGEDECKCWTIRKGFKAPQAAGVIHGDFERGFICAEVMAFDELKEAGSEGEVKAKGRYRQEGKLYVVEDGDVIFFKCASGEFRPVSVSRAAV